jgi:hypothetical protein
MKKLIIELKEYESMIDTIQKQQEVINHFEEQSNVVLIDERYSREYFYDCIRVRIPLIRAKDESLAKQYLQDEFESISKYIDKVSYDMKKEEKEEKNNKKWWEF